MADRWRLAAIEVERFRGVAKPLNLEFLPELNVLTGKNGAGKTSICHSIEWAFFGKVPVLTGGEFQAEDAIANRVAVDGGVSRVRLTLRTDRREVVITRIRKRGESSTRGTSTVTVEQDGQALNGKEAEARIAEIVGIPSGEFGASVYLRQDTIADLVLGNEDLRSAAIDKLLGLGDVRELLENLQLGPIERMIRQLEGEIASQKENVISAATMRRVQLARKREALVSRGLEESALAAVGMGRMIEEERQRLGVAAEALGLVAPRSEECPSQVEPLASAVEDLEADIQVVEHVLTDQAVEIRQRAGRLEDLRQRFNRALEVDRDLEEIDLEALTENLRQLQDEIKHVEAEATVKRHLHAEVKPICEELLGMAPSLDSLRTTVSFVEGEDLPGQLQRVADDASAIAAQLQLQSSLTQLLLISKDHMTKHPAETCPICDQSIEFESVLIRIEQLLSQQGQEAKVLAKRMDQLNQTRQEMGRRLEIFENDRKTLESAETRRNELMNRLREKGIQLAAGSIQEIEAAGAAAEQEWRKSAEYQTSVEDKRRALEAGIRDVESARRELDAIRSDVQRAVGSTERPTDVLGAISGAEAVTAQRNQTILGARQALDLIRGRLATIREGVFYLEDEKEVAELLQNVPPVERRIRQLAAARGRVLRLRGALLEVQDALSAVQDQALAGNLATLMPGMQEMFTALGGHPEFRRLVIEPDRDEKTGTNTYRLRAQEEDGTGGTFVRTTFSRGELNAVALSLFLAVAQAIDSELAVIVLDDPSQSLDVARQQSLADMLREMSANRQVLVASEDLGFLQMLQSGASDQVINLKHEPFEGTLAHAQQAGGGH